MTDASKKAQDDLRVLFGIMGITRVVVVDDVFSASPDAGNIVGQCRSLVASNKKDLLPGIQELSGLDADVDDDDVLVTRIRAIVDGLPADRRKSLAVRLADLMDHDHGEEGARSELIALLAGYDVQLLSPDQWQADKANLLDNSVRAKTMFLFDQDLTQAGGRQTEGMQIIASLMKDAATNDIYCGLLTHTVNRDEELDAWSKLADANEIKAHRDRFVVISKSHLAGDPSAFCFRIKRVAITGKCNDLKACAATVLNEAHAQAARQLNDMNVYDFEQIVFQSSFLEGVWEPDTLFRVFSLFHRRVARGLAKQNAQLGTLADTVRQVIRIPYRPEDAPESSSWRIQRMEFYEDQEYLNAHLSPLDLGDLFQRTTGSKKKFVLLGPPCDLMVRPGGKRDGTREGIIAEVVSKEPKRMEGFFKLPFFGETDGSHGWAKFRETVSVQLCLLDLCAIRSDGVGRLRVNDAVPAGLIPAWKERHGILRDEVRKIVERFDNAKKGCVSGKSQAAEMLMSGYLTGSSQNFVPGRIDVPNREVNYEIKRVGRVKGALAAALLRAYGLYLSRDAFEHDITREMHEAAKESDQGTQENVADVK